jgi:hypothetical protein
MNQMARGEQFEIVMRMAGDVRFSGRSRPSADRSPGGATYLVKMFFNPMNRPVTHRVLSTLAIKITAFSIRQLAAAESLIALASSTRWPARFRRRDR